MAPENAPPTVRAFLAVPLPEAVTRAARHLQRRLADDLQDIRWVRPETLHLTLRFFGEVEEEFLENIGEVMLSVGHLHAPFEVELAGVGVFPSPGRARVVWLGVTQGRKELTALHTTLAEKLQRIGVAAEKRRFSPHLTLGRSRRRPENANRALERFREFSCGTFKVGRLVLFESRLRPQGALHLPRKTVYLGGERDGHEPPGAPEHS